MNSENDLSNFVSIYQANSGKDLETIILLLRNAGARRTQTIKVLADERALSIGEAKELVTSSKAWSDEYENTIALHTSIVQALNRLEEE